METVEHTPSQMAFLETLDARTKNLTIKYHKALIELQEILTYTNFIRMNHFIKTRKLNGSLARVLISGGIITTNGKKAAALRYKWNKDKAPTLLLAAKVVDDLRKVNDQYIQNAEKKKMVEADKNGENYETSFSQEMLESLADSGAEIRPGKRLYRMKDGDIVVGDVDNPPFPPDSVAEPKEKVETKTNLEQKRAEHEEKVAEKTKKKEDPKPKNNGLGAIPSIEEVQKMMDIMAPMMEPVLKEMIPGVLPKPKRMEFSFMWGLIKYVKIK